MLPALFDMTNLVNGNGNNTEKEIEIQKEREKIGTKSNVLAKKLPADLGSELGIRFGH